jgi:transcriptional regulator with XRE-family HTH domain
MTFDQDRFNERFTRLRQERGYTKRSLDEAIRKIDPARGLSQDTQDGWARGHRPSIDRVVILADFFGVSIDYLLGAEER